jgi:hypothetical protein
MYQKDNRFYADWRDKRGNRRRKAFTSGEAAQTYEDAQKELARPKALAAGEPSRKSSYRGSSQTRERTGGGTGTSTTRAGRSSPKLAQSGRATSQASRSCRPSRSNRGIRKG